MGKFTALDELEYLASKLNALREAEYLASESYPAMLPDLEKLHRKAFSRLKVLAKRALKAKVSLGVDRIS